MSERRKDNIKIVIVICLIIFLIIALFGPKPLRLYARRIGIDHIELVDGLDNRYAIISDDNYKELYREINKSFFFTSFVQLKIYSLTRIVIFYKNGTVKYFSSTHVKGNIVPIFKNTFDFNVAYSLVDEWIPIGDEGKAAHGFN